MQPLIKTKKVCLVFLHRLPQRVSERLLEGAVVRGARWKPVPAEGPRRPAAARRHGAAQRCRGGARRPRPQTSLLFLHPAVGQRTSVSRGDLVVHQSNNDVLPGRYNDVFWKLKGLWLWSIRPAAQRIWVVGWACCLQRLAAPARLRSCTTTTSTWTRSLTYDTLPDTPSCESLP